MLCWAAPMHTGTDAAENFWKKLRVEPYNKFHITLYKKEGKKSFDSKRRTGMYAIAKKESDIYLPDDIAKKVIQIQKV